MTLTPEQTALVASPRRHLYIEAGPGAGKTRVLAQRARFLLEESRAPFGGLVALTFSRAMARDLRAQVEGALPSSWPCRGCRGERKVGGYDCPRCAGAGVVTGEAATVGTIHSVGLRFVRLALEGGLAGGAAVRATGLVTGADFGVAAPEDIDDIVEAAATMAGKKRVGKRALAAFVARGVAPDQSAEALGRRLLLDRGLLTFSDILRLFAVVAGARGDDSLHARFPAVLVDEEQDLSPEAWAILDAWAPKELTAAGDDAQRVFSFFGSARREAPRQGLGANHRAPVTLVDFGGRLRRALAAEGICSGLEMSSARGPGGEARLSRPMWDAQHLEVLDLLFAHPPEHVAVLAPTHELLDEARFALAQVGVVAERIERPRDVWRTHAGRAVLAVAQAAAQQTVAEWMVRQAARATGWPEPQDLLDAVARSYRDACPLGNVLGLPWASYALGDVWLWADQQAQVSRAFDAPAAALEDYMRAHPRSHPQAFLAAVASQEADRVVARPGVVTLATWHGAKGLEWPAVAVLGACEGSVPWAREAEDVAAWSRAFYVACTRARESLLVVAPLDCRGTPREPLRPLTLAGLAPATTPARDAPGMKEDA